jgi:hypothetical protein
LHTDIIINTRTLEMSLLMLFIFFLFHVSLGSYIYNIEPMTTNKFLIVLTKYFMNISVNLMQLAKKHYRFFVVNKIFVYLAQIFINLSYTIMIFVNKLI